MAKEPLKNKYGYTLAQVEQALSTLSILRQRAKTNQLPYPEMSICYNWLLLFPAFPIVRMVRQLAKGWEPHSGNPFYPIPHTRRDLQRCGWAMDPQPWEGEQLALRLDLMAHMRHRLCDWRRHLRNAEARRTAR